MTIYPGDLIYSPPILPPYLKNVHELQPIIGVPSNQELIEIHAVMQMAEKAIDFPGMGDATLLSRLSGHLFDVQMARYRSKYLSFTFPENTLYKPPALPIHFSVPLESISGVPSDEEIIKVQSAVRAYQQFSNASSIFDPVINMELSQHLFDIQMARHVQRAKQSCSTPASHNIPGLNPIERTPDILETENTRTRSDAVGSDQLAQRVPDAIERSNRLAEQANQLAERANILIERSNQIAERANQLTERSSQPAEQSNGLIERLTECFGRLNERLEQSNRLVEASTKPTEKLEEVLRSVNKVLVGIHQTRAIECRPDSV